MRSGRAAFFIGAAFAIAKRLRLARSQQRFDIAAAVSGNSNLPASAIHQHLELLPELETEVHGFDGIHTVVGVANSGRGALRDPTQFAALVKGVLDVGFQVPVFHAGTHREIERRKMRQIAGQIVLLRLQRRGARALMDGHALDEAFIIADIEFVTYSAVDLQSRRDGQSRTARSIRISAVVRDLLGAWIGIAVCLRGSRIDVSAGS